MKTIREYSNDVEPSFVSYIGELLKFMSYCKIRKPDIFSTNKNYFVVTIVGSLLISDLMLIITALIEFKNASNDLTTFAAYVGPFCLQFMGFMKWSYCIWKINDISKLLKILENCHRFGTRINRNDLGWKRYRTEMTVTRRNYLIFLYGWLCLCMYGIFHWCTNPLILEIKENGFTAESKNITRTRNLPYLGWRPWNVNNNFGYVSMFIVQFIGGMGSAIGCITFDVFYVSSLMIISAHLRYLNDSLVDDIDISFLNALEVMASPPMFVQCLENIIVLCMVSLEASTIEINTNFGTIMKLWSMMEYFLSVIAQLFVYCYYATEIRELGLKTADSVYQCCWEKLICNYPDCNEIDRRSMKRIYFLIKTIMIRAQKEILLTGGPFYVLSLETFKSVVGIAMSNSVILRQVVSEER